MKTILKFLNVFTLIFIVSITIDAFGKLYAIVHHLFYNSNKLMIDGVVFPSEWSNLSIIIFLLFSSILIFFLVYLAFIFREVITSFSKNKYFSSKNAKQLSKVGKGLIFYGIGIFILSVVLNFYSIEFTSYNFGRIIGNSVAKSMPVFIFLSFILLIASIIKKGNVLQEENELTI